MSSLSSPPWKSNGTYRSSPLPLTPPPACEVPRLDLPPLTLSQQEDLVTRLYPKDKEQQKKPPKDTKVAFGTHYLIHKKG